MPSHYKTIHTTSEPPLTTNRLPADSQRLTDWHQRIPSYLMMRSTLHCTKSWNVLLIKMITLMN